MKVEHTVPPSTIIGQMPDRLLDELASREASLSADGRTVEVQLTINAGSMGQAISEAERVVKLAVRKAGGASPVVVFGEAQTPEHLAAGIETPNHIELVGISELAELLGVTRQRASQIASRPNFPAPYARLKAGPIWNKASLSRVLETWTRVPGPRPGTRRATSSEREVVRQ